MTSPKNTCMLLFLLAQLFGCSSTQTTDKKEMRRLIAPRSIQVGRWVGESDLPKGLTWRAVGGATKYIIEVFELKSESLVLTFESDGPSYIFARRELIRRTPGFYFFRVAAVDRRGNTGAFSSCKWSYIGNRKELGRFPASTARWVCKSATSLNRVPK